MLLIEHILDAIAPHSCLGCGVEGILICGECAGRAVRVPSRCYRCHVATEDYKTCSSCRRNTSLRTVRSIFVYDGVAKSLVCKMKYERLRSGAKGAARLMIEATDREIGAELVITHAPTATSRVRERGYDQAALIAKELAKEFGAVYAPLLSRFGQQRQVGKNRKQRRAQMRELFAAKNNEIFKKKDVLIVDDVITTGATLEACAAVLARAGAKSVRAVTFTAA